MKLLLITNDLAPSFNANSSIADRLASTLHERYGVEVSVLGLQTKAGQVYDFPTTAIPNQYFYTQAIPSGLPFCRKLWQLMAHPSVWPMFLRYRLKRHPLEGLYRRSIRRLLRQEPDIDCILAVSEPTDIPCAMTSLKCGIPWISYRLDPWSTNFQYDSDKRAREEEQAADRSCAAVFVQPAVYQEYMSGANTAPADKLYMAEFPNLVPLPEGEAGADWDRSKIHCAYVGQLYPDIRDPSFMLRLFSALRDSGIVLHVIGDAPGQAARWQSLLAENIVLHGRVPYAEAAAYMKAADILVNLGNSVANQMPSKVIDYIAAGKPVLNLYKREDCPTLRYMERHPAALSVLESSGGPDLRTVDEVRKFCGQKRGCSVPFAEMARIYRTCTPEYVAVQLYDVLRNIVVNKQNASEQ